MNTNLTTDLRELTSDEFDAIAGASTHAEVKLFGIVLWRFDDTEHGTSWSGPDGVRHTVWKD
jgi:hypothetical protein